MFIDISGGERAFNGAVAAAVVAQDALSAYDEVGNAKDKSVPPQLAYALVNGAERVRANRDGSARAARQFRTVVLSNGEYSMAEFAALAGMPHHEGQEIRLLDIQVQDDASRSAAYRELGTDEFGARVADAIRDDYGHAGVAFVSRLLAHAALFGGVRNLARDAFAGVDACMYRPLDVAANVLRARATFVLFATAGELAVQLGVLGQGWQIGDMTEACGRAFRVWLDARAERGDLSESGETQRAAQAFREMTETTHGRWAAPGQPLFKDCIGWCETTAVGTAYYVQDGALKQVLKDFAPARLAALLIGKGMVLSGRGNVATKPAKTFTARLGGGSVKVRGFLIPQEAASDSDDEGAAAAPGAFATAAALATMH